MSRAEARLEPAIVLLDGLQVPPRPSRSTELRNGSRRGRQNRGGRDDGRRERDGPPSNEHGLSSPYRFLAGTRTAPRGGRRLSSAALIPVPRGHERTSAG